MTFPYHKQNTDYTCGAASMRMVLEVNGIKKSEKQIAKLLGTNKIRGTWSKNFSKVAKKYKLNYIVRRNGTIKELKQLSDNKYTIILWYFCLSEKEDHYSVLKKIDSKYIYFWDPWFGPKHKFSLTHFKRIWKSDIKYENVKRWFFAVKNR